MNIRILVIFLLQFLLLLTGCGQNGHIAGTQSVELQQQPDQICYNLDIALIDSSNTKAIIKAGRAIIYNDSNKTILDSGVNVQFYNICGKKTGVLTANSVIIDDITKNMVATGNVIVVSDSSKTTLYTNELEWNNASKLVHNNTYVKIKSATEIIEGIGIITDEKLSNYKIFNVTGVKGF